ncbi:hypothetical protein ACTXIU_11850 [Glutamicibacter arilaitensis]|uniref:hypothetical protein n=1 Tax=Glutamicibacter arilaitensis TaxID=256701 RepID=UPI003F8F769B
MRTLKTSTAITVSAMFDLFGLSACNSSENSVNRNTPSPAAPIENVPLAEEPAGRQVPAECEKLDLRLGSQLEGKALGECVAVAISSYKSGKMKIKGDSDGTFEFTYDPDFKVQGEIQTDTSTIKMAFLGDEMWLDSGNGPVKGDRDSENEEELMAAVVGELTRELADPVQTTKLINAQPTWNVDTSKSSVTLVNGGQTDAYRIASAGPFDWHEIKVEEFVLWFDEDWVPLSTEATSGMLGMSATNSQQFYDLGEPVEIIPLG